MKPRPSRLALHFRCPGSLSLEAVERSTEAGDEGSKRHRWLAQHPELAVRELGLTGEVFTEEPVRLAFMAGTADLIAAGPPVTVVDWKLAGEDKGSPKESPQLLGYALGVSAERVAFIYVEPSGPDGECKVVRSRMESVSQDDLHAFANSLYELIEGPHDQFTTGNHCARCPGATSCPALREQVSLALEEHALVLNEDTAAKAWARLKAVKAACEIAEDAVKAFASSHPVPLPNGKVLGATQTSREEIVPAVALSLFPELRQAAETRLTKAMVVSILGQEGLVALRLAGGTKTLIGTSVKEHAREHAP